MIGGDRDLGAEIVRAARAAGYTPAACAREAIADAGEEDCDRLVADLRPRAVVDCNAPDEAPAGRVARAASRAGALSVITSCADVFDGQLDRPYVESDVPRPATPAGVARLAAERAVAWSNERHVIVRTSWILGMSGPAMEPLIAAGASGRHLPVDDLTRGTPMLAAEVAEGIVSFLAGGRYGVYHPGGGGSCTALELARVIFRALGLPARAIPPTGATAPRRQDALDTRRRGAPRIRDWRLAAAAFAEAHPRGTARAEVPAG